MKKLTHILLTAAAGFTLLISVSCSKEEENTGVDPLAADEVSGRVLWERISSEADYTNYAFWPGHEGLNPGQAPHGPFHKIYINFVIADKLPLEDKLVPDGGIIVKENYSNGKEFAGITVMAKVDGYDPEHNDWFWAKYGPDGNIDAEGKPNGCISCHAGMEQNDYVIVHPLDRE